MSAFTTPYNPRQGQRCRVGRLSKRTRSGHTHTPENGAGGAARDPVQGKGQRQAPILLIRPRHQPETGGVEPDFSDECDRFEGNGRDTSPHTPADSAVSRDGS